MNINQMISSIKGMRETATDEVALQSIDLYQKWATNKEVKVGDRRQHNGTLYRCIQAHTTQTGWEPNKTPALWVVVSLEEWPAWVQPLGAHDAYAQGAKVTHLNKKWTSNINGNVWEPGAHGWTEHIE